MATERNNPSRRTVLGALATTPMLAGTIGTAIAAEAATPDRAHWYALKAEHERLCAAAEAFDRDFGNPAIKAASAEIERLPHVSVRLPGGGNWTTASHDDVRLARDLAANYGDTDTGETMRACRELIGAADQREAEVRTIRDRHRACEYGRRVDELFSAAVNAEVILLDTPAPDRPALLWKLEKLLATGPDGGTENWTAECVAQTMADARRLLSGEA